MNKENKKLGMGLGALLSTTNGIKTMLTKLIFQKFTKQTTA